MRVQQRKPLLLHFDVNKTVILTDSIDAKTMDACIREAISDMYWGQVSADGQQWQWFGPGTVCARPPATEGALSYHDFCKRIIPEKDARKPVVREFSKVEPETKTAMEQTVKDAVARMELPIPGKGDPGLEKAGLNKECYLMLPGLFKLVASLVKRKIKFSLVFRSFGQDHDKIRNEWNAFCERRHPIFSHLLDGVGPLDGSVLGIPDKRLDRIHTVYRDEHGPVLALDTFTNGPKESTWDAWVKAKPKPLEDTRNGRAFFAKEGAKCMDGMIAIASYFESLLIAETTVAMKDDWAWWTWHKEASHAGKLMLALENANVLFFDDNIEVLDAHIVDCREADGSVMTRERIKESCVRVNPVEALLNEDYYLEEIESRCGWQDLAIEFEEPAITAFSKEMQVADFALPQDDGSMDTGGDWSSMSLFNFFSCCNATSCQQRQGNRTVTVKG
mmetsp:Transcript_30427/g.70058  ORF Transcript_30427/g.70058 Transcript_30427/m.70058 type:complete len:447 (+) Transcript_30427:71-1411(+)